MTVRETIGRLAGQEDLNFLLTNRIPRRLATTFVGWISRIRNPLVSQPTIALWRLFCDVDLSDAAEARFETMQACFTRRLKPGSRSFDSDPDVLASPCDAILGAHGRIEGGRAFQVKGFPYSLTDLLGDAAEAQPFIDGTYATLRLTAGMYHRFHAPADLAVDQVTYLSGDCWNVNPIALKRVERLFCRNERAIIRAREQTHGDPVLLVAVAAVLVASIRLTCLDTEAALRTHGPGKRPVDAAARRGEEMGWFEQGSTILLFAPPGWHVADGLAEGTRIRAGQRLMHRTGLFPEAGSARAGAVSPHHDQH